MCDLRAFVQITGVHDQSTCIGYLAYMLHAEVVRQVILGNDYAAPLRICNWGLALKNHEVDSSKWILTVVRGRDVWI
jgi:hypothetical protein